MDENNIDEPLASYAATGSEAAFRELVRRYIDFVYSTALRKLGGDTHLAEDITQQVFTDLAAKATTLPRNVLIGGWLHRHTCFLASKLVRSETRRRAREKQAAHMNTNDPDPVWNELAPILDDAVDALDSTDREAILLRFFEKCDFRSVGSALGVSDDTAQKRVSRALEKLKTLLSQRGVALSDAALGTVLADHVVASAHPDFTADVAATAFRKLKGEQGIAAPVTKLGSPWKFGFISAVFVGLLGLVIMLQLNNSETRESAEQVSAPDVIVSSELRNSRNIPDLNADQGAQAESSNPGAHSNGSSLDNSNLELTIAAADSGKPVPNTPIDVRYGINGDFERKQRLVSDRIGICNVPVRPGIEVLELTTRLEGFADTRLQWWPIRGDTIPANYTVRLDRPIQIGGRVLDENDQPIEGASVYFGCNPDLGLRKGPESHDFDWVNAKTDRQGRWEINRIGADVWSRAFGYAEHTNYASEHLGQTLPADAAEQLRAGTHIFRLKQTITLTGVVVDSEGQPVTGAKVIINGDDDRKATTDTRGSFSLAGCAPGRTRVTAKAEGFASETVETNLLTGFSPIKVVLQRGKPLRLRIVNTAGEPVTNAMAQMRMIKRPSGVYDFAVFHRLEPDAEGRVVWNAAPKEEMLFSVFAKTYGEETFYIRADGEEHLVKLSPAVVVRGTVRDERGEFISRFRIAVGTPQEAAKKTSVKWGLNPDEWLNFTGGSYEHTFEHWDSLHHLSPNIKNPGYVLKFEADGHASFISRVIRPDEGDVRLDVALKRAPATTVEVLLPTGQPAAGAEIALVLPGMWDLRLESGRFGSIVQGGRLVANQRGEFQLPADESVEKIVVVHAEGYAEVEPAQLTARPVINLQAWGNIEGTFFSRGEPLAGVAFYAVRVPQTVYFDMYPVTDDKGRFTFSKLPPGDYKLQWRIPRAANSAERDAGFSKHVNVQAGETSTVNIGDSGYEITARLRWPDGWQPNGQFRIKGTITAPLPGEIQTRLALAFSAQPESTVYFGLSFDPETNLAVSPDIRATLEQASHYAFRPGADGSFVAEGVEAGSGLVTFIVEDKAESERQRKIVIAASGVAVITVPSDPPTGKIDMGEIELRMHVEPQP
ncbi:MAG: sigma-70 family RNA polymerase sigma factor [Limisphaerales bacterium]